MLICRLPFHLYIYKIKPILRNNDLTSCFIQLEEHVTFAPFRMSPWGMETRCKIRRRLIGKWYLRYKHMIFKELRLLAFNTSISEFYQIISYEKLPFLVDEERLSFLVYQDFHHYLGTVPVAFSYTNHNSCKRVYEDIRTIIS